MHKILGKYDGFFYALLRIVTGLLFFLHGLQKVFGIGGQQVADLASLKGLAGIIELVAGALVLIGLYASWAAFVASGQMAVAYFMVHLPQGLHPLQNGGQAALLFCFVFLYVAARGNGPLSLGGKRR